MSKIVKSNYSSMKNLVIKLLIIVEIIFIVATTSSAQSGNGELLFTSGTTGNLTWMLYTDGSLIIKGSGTMPNYPAGDTPWSSYMNSITSVTIENGVTTVGNNAFRDGTNIKIVTMPNSITVIRENAFSNCSKIAEISFLSTTPQQIEIRDNAFLNVEKSNCKLWVPDEAVALYRFAIDWRDFIVSALSKYSVYTETSTNESEENTHVDEKISNMNESAFLYIYRKRKVLDILPKRYDVLLDNIVVGNSTNNWKTTVPVNTYGAKTISASIDGKKAEVHINFEPGGKYYIRSDVFSETRNTGKTQTITARDGSKRTEAVTEIIYTPILQLMESRLGASEFNAITVK